MCRYTFIVECYLLKNTCIYFKTQVYAVQNNVVIIKYHCFLLVAAESKHLLQILILKHCLLIIECCLLGIEY